MQAAPIAIAQQKVAILETVDKAQNVSYGVKLLLRGSLTAAISSTPGYEGYDRVDMASIAGEQEFQRTGNVSDNQIKEIGAASGADYVLVAEAAKFDAENVIITAKLLDVETFGVLNSTVLVSGIESRQMQLSCESLARKLLDPGALSKANRAMAEAASKRAVKQNGIETMLVKTDTPDTYLYVATKDAETSSMSYTKAVKSCACKGEGWRLPAEQEFDLVFAQHESLVSKQVVYWVNDDSKKVVEFSSGKGRSYPRPVGLGYVRCVKEVKQ